MKHFCKKLVVAVLTYEAKVLLRRHRPYIIAVTGSVGKTTTKDAIYAVLKNHVSARKSEKSFNSDIGVPLSVLGLPNAWSSPLHWCKNFIDGAWAAFLSKEYPEVLILETGVDRPGDMATLTSWLKPDMVVITRLPDVPVHVEFFSSPEAVVVEKLELLKALKPDGVFIYNHDDTKLQEAVTTVRQQAIGYSRYVPSHYTIGNDQIVNRDGLPVGMRARLTHLHEAIEVQLEGALGVASMYTVAAAAAVASEFNITIKEVAEDMLTFVPPPGRMRVIPGLKNTTIIDDTYNSSPTAVASALETLREIKGAKRKIAVLGDMLELGKYSSDEHERVGALAAQSADVLITLGIRSRKTAAAALAHGMNDKVVFQYDDVDRAGRELQTLLKLGDVVLVKASQGLRAERIVEEVMAEPERAGELLARQSTTWRRR